jgi:hypothetical protein
MEIPILHILIVYLIFTILPLRPQIGIEQPDSLEIQRRVLQKEYPTDNYAMLLYYPEIFNERQEMHYDLNFEVRRIMTEAITDFQNEVQREGAPNPDSMSKLLLDYQVCLFDKGIVSFHFNETYFYASSKRNMSEHEAMSYNLVTHEFIQLSQFFKDYQVSKKELNQLIKEYGGSCKEFDGIQRFCLEPEHLVVFHPNKDTDHNCIESVKIPYSRILHLISPEMLAHPLFQD